MAVETRDQQVEILVRGLVQGVGYRAHTRSRAVQLGLRGWARNNPDGTVTVVAEGPRDALLALIDACRRGPRGADVTGLEVRWGPATGLPPGFSIR